MSVTEFLPKFAQGITAAAILVCAVPAAAQQVPAFDLKTFHPPAKDATGKYPPQPCDQQSLCLRTPPLKASDQLALSITLIPDPKHDTGFVSLYSRKGIPLPGMEDGRGSLKMRRAVLTATLIF